MAYPTTTNNLPHTHAAGQTILAADIDAIEVDVDQLTLKVGSGTSTPTNGLVLTGGVTAGTSTWLAAGSVGGGLPVFNIKAYGAAVDGVTDDTAAWVAAYNAAVTAAGGVIAMPAGVSIITQLAITANNIVIRGVGATLSTVKSKVAANKIPFLFYNVSGTMLNVGMEDIGVDNNAVNQTIANGNTGSAAWIAVYGSGTFEATNGLTTATFYNCAGVFVRRCKFINGLCGAIGATFCDNVDISNNTIQNAAMIRSLQSGFFQVGANSISILSKPSNVTYPGQGFRVANNDIYLVTDVGIDIHGNGANYCTVVGNTVRGKISGTANGASYWGIFTEMEAADTVDNVGVAVTGNYVADLNVGYGSNNNLNTGHDLYSGAFSGNVAFNCASFAQADGSFISFTGNTCYKCQQGIVIGGTVNVAHRQLTFIGNSLHINGNTNAFNVAFLIRPGTNLTYSDITILGNNCYGGGVGYQACSGMFIDSNGTGSTVTRVRAEANRFFNFSEGIHVAATGTVGTATVSSNTTDWTFTVANTLVAGTQVNVTGATVNAYNGIWTVATAAAGSFTVHLTGNPGAATGAVVGSVTTDIQLVNNDCYSNLDWGIELLSGTAVTIEGGTLSGNASGSLTGASATICRRVRGVIGFNDTLTTATPAVGASPYTIPATYRDSTINLSGGTVSAVTLGGVATGATTGMFTVPAGQRLVVTHTGAPTATQVSY